MEGHRHHVRNASWLVFAISIIVYWFSVERVGSLWDVGEFILGAYKMQVVHPPGAPLFLMVGRLFAWVGELVSDDPSTIAWAVNFLSAVCTAFAAFFIAQSTGILGKYALVTGPREATAGEGIALGMASLVAGLSTAFATSIWFSAVEGEVYAMSTLFTTMTFWAMVRWYDLPDTARADRWIVFAVFATGLSVGVHLLSLLTFPALAIFYFAKKHPLGTPFATRVGGILAWIIAVLSGIVALVALSGSVFSIVFFGAAAVGFGYLGLLAFRDASARTPALDRAVGGLAAALGGVIVLIFAQAAVIKGIPAMWAKLEIFMVNGLGLPFHSGLIPLGLIIAAVLYFGFRYARQNGSRSVELITMSAMMLVVGFSVVGVVMIRANANPPINMNAPTDAMRLQYYLNREQYGDRPLLYGPTFEAQPTNYEYEDSYGRVGDEYEVVDQKLTPVYRAADKMLFPRMADGSQGRPQIYRQVWMDHATGPITMLDNLKFFVQYQLDWMYWRYFMWNFSGRQNHAQGFYDSDPSSGNWITGIDFIDESLLGVNLEFLPEEARDDEGRNAYYALPFVFGLFGLVFHLRRRPEDFLAILALFVITGIGIILYTNQPPNEPRERDYVQAGAIFMYCVWIGMGVLAIFDVLRTRVLKDGGLVPAAIAGALVLSAPALMAFQGFDDHSRMDHRASRDYAANFLNSLAPNAIIFTYGDNDTYPLWYAQEVENIRPDVRVINLSLIAVDWYIDLMRRKINDSPPIKMTIPQSAMRGELRNQILIRDPNDPRTGGVRPMPIQAVLDYVAGDHPVQLQGGQTLATDFPTDQVFIPVTPEAARASGVIDDLGDSASISRVDLGLGGSRSILKDDLAIMDIIGSNAWERPIYFAVTVPDSKMLGLRDYFRLEGLALRLTPVKSPSDKTFGPVGAGRVDVDKVYDNITQKFAWGNFDKENLFVDPSYAPSVQMTQFVLIRTISEMLQAGDQERAGELAKLYFDAFPHDNFPFDANTLFPMRVLLQTGQEEEAKRHIRTLSNSLAQWRDFYASQRPELISPQGAFGRDYNQNAGTIAELERQIFPLVKDKAFVGEVNQLLGGATVGTNPQELGQPPVQQSIEVPEVDAINNVTPQPGDTSGGL